MQTTLTALDIVLLSALGQLLAASAMAIAYALVAVLRLLNEWREDMGELRRQRRRERLQKRLAECGA